MDNPFAPPAVSELLPRVHADSDDERIRREHLKHEASIQSIGLLYWLSVPVVAVTAVGSFNEAPVGAVIGASLLILAVVLALLGRQIRRLDPRTKVPVVILSTIGLIGFPVGTVINAYALYLFLSPKGSVVLSPAYHRVVERTPHIRYRSSKIVLAAGVLLLVFLAVVISRIFAA